MVFIDFFFLVGGTSLNPGSECLFPSSDYRSSQLWFVQICFLTLCPSQHSLELQLYVNFSFWSYHLFPLTFPHGFLIIFSFYLRFLPCHQLLCSSLMLLTFSSISLTLVLRTSSLDCISCNWFFISAWLDLYSAVMKSLESFMLFPEPPVAS